MRTNDKEIIQFNNIPVIQLQECRIQWAANTEVLHSTDIFGFLNVNEKEKAAKFCGVVRCSSVRP